MTMLSYTCATEDMPIHGLYQANLLHTITVGIEEHVGEEKYFHKGRWWMSGTAEDFADIHVYLSPGQVRYYLNGLIKKGVLITGNYNKWKNDRTNWYSFSNEEYERRVGMPVEVHEYL